MKFGEFLEKTGISTSFICKKMGVCRTTVYRVRDGIPVSSDVANEFKDFFGQDLEIACINTHVRNRTKSKKIDL